MKSWHTRITYGLAVVAAAVAVPLSAGSASAASWQFLGGGPQVFSNMQECNDYGDDMVKKGDFEQYRCWENADGIYMDALK